MRKNEVKIGGRYTAKIAGNLTVVRITGVSQYGGWQAVNERTGRSVRIKGAAKLRGAVGAEERRSIAVQRERTRGPVTGTVQASEIREHPTQSLSARDHLQRKQLWISNRGEVACVEHGGDYLARAVERNPNVREHSTPLDHWMLLDADRVRAYGVDPETLACETCKRARPMTTKEFEVEGRKVLVTADHEELARIASGRQCEECGADIIGNDPHQPGCSRGGEIDLTPNVLNARVIRAKVGRAGIDALASLLSHDPMLLVADDEGGLVSLDEYHALQGLLSNLTSPFAEIVQP